MTPEKIKKTLEFHAEWLNDSQKGERANLTGADLTRANLTGANLTRADLYGADLYGAEGIFQFGPMPTSGRIIYAVRHDNAVMINSGCFWGTVQELREKVKEDHNCPVYLAICDMLENPSFKFNA